MNQVSRPLRGLFAAALLALAAASCGTGDGSPSPSAGEKLNVVATSTVLADFVSQVGGDLVTVNSLVPRGGEVHTFDPAPSDAAAVSNARLLVMNGLGLDDWLLPFARQAGAGDVARIALGENIEDAEYIEDEETGSANPHLWMNVAYSQVYVDRIRLKLIELDPTNQAQYDANAAAYDQRLAALDDWVTTQLNGIPASDRRVVSFHDAFPYFAAAYGLELVGVVVESPGQDPSAADVAALVDAIRESGVRAILSEVQFSNDLAQTLADETGATVVSDLYTDSLGDPPIDTFEAAMRHDVDQIAAGLR